MGSGFDIRRLHQTTVKSYRRATGDDFPYVAVPEPHPSNPDQWHLHVATHGFIDGFDGVTFGIHLCRGNQRSMWHREGTYDAIAERLFSELPHDRFLLEYDSPRAGNFEPLRFVPEGQLVVLGLVSTKVPQLESVDDLARRIAEASKVVPLDRLAISPQCGFGSDAVGNLIGEDDQKRKLELVVETARRVWG